jgi:hypothetical protein
MRVSESRVAPAIIQSPSAPTRGARGRTAIARLVCYFYFGGGGRQSEPARLASPRSGGGLLAWQAAAKLGGWQRQARGGLRVASLVFVAIGQTELFILLAGSAPPARPMPLADTRPAHRQRRLRHPQRETRAIRAELRCEIDRSRQPQFLARFPPL